MFPGPYFPARYFNPRYWVKEGSTTVEQTGGGWAEAVFSYSPGATEAWNWSPGSEGVNDPAPGAVAVGGGR